MEHPCNVKKIKIFAGVNKQCMTEILQVDLANDSRAETFQIHTKICERTSRLPWPCSETSVHGSRVVAMEYLPSIWRVSLTGIIHDWKACYLERSRLEHGEASSAFQESHAELTRSGRLPSGLQQCWQTPYAPFGRTPSDTDIVFRSRSGVDFHVHKSVIAKMSSVWRDMLSFPQNPNLDPDIPQVVTLTEDTKTLDNIFRLCYPTTHPHFASIDNVCAALDAANKYMMDPITARIENSLLQFLDSEPLRVYSVAYIHQCGNVARAAARRLVADPSFAYPLHPPPEFNYLPAIALSTVAAYRRKYVKAALEAFGDHKWMHSGDHARRFSESSTSSATGGPKTWVWLECTACPRGPPMMVKRGAPVVNNMVYPTRWWWKYFDAAKEELSLRPFGSVVAEFQLTLPAIAAASRCETCGPRALLDLMEYTDAMAERIREATHKVQVELPFGKAGSCSHT
ncbi:hypothetical protein C8Q79DRAFT_715421 [Trametes meyenii]|nr:hypothetical protein C8Q79DRAFT_715421 [Trametes meyenii]